MAPRIVKPVVHDHSWPKLVVLVTGGGVVVLGVGVDAVQLHAAEVEAVLLVLREHGFIHTFWYPVVVVKSHSICAQHGASSNEDMHAGVQPRLEVGDGLAGGRIPEGEQHPRALVLPECATRDVSHDLEPLPWCVRHRKV